MLVLLRHNGGRLRRCQAEPPHLCDDFGQRPAIEERWDRSLARWLFNTGKGSVVQEVSARRSTDNEVGVSESVGRDEVVNWLPDHSAFNKLYAANGGMVRRILGANVPSTEVDDLSQTVWLIALQK